MSMGRTGVDENPIDREFEEEERQTDRDLDEDDEREEELPEPEYDDPEPAAVSLRVWIDDREIGWVDVAEVDSSWIYPYELVEELRARALLGVEVVIERVGVRYRTGADGALEETPSEWWQYDENCESLELEDGSYVVLSTRGMEPEGSVDNL